MIVRRVVGPWFTWESFVAACPVLDPIVAGARQYVGDPHGVFGSAVRLGGWSGFHGVFESWPWEGWRVVFVGNPIRCGSRDVEMLIAGSDGEQAVQFYYQLGALYGKRLDVARYATGDDSF